jgi:signal transduction histidine kinase/ActR/RegA family two-component response regulator
MSDGITEPTSFVHDLVEGLHGAVLATDLDLRIVAVNAQWERDLRTPSDQAVGRDFLEVVPSAEQYSGAFRRCLTGEIIKSDRIRVIGASGRPSWLQNTLIPWRDASGEVGGMLMVNLRHTADDETDQSTIAADRLEDAVALADVYVWEINHQTRTTWGAGADDTFFQGAKGYSQIVEDGRTGGIHPDDRARVDVEWAEQEARGEDTRAEYRLNRDDKLIWVMSAARTALGPNGDPIRTLGVMQNITARKLAELAADEANATKSTFLATMSHEIRTPLNGVLGMAQAMAAGELSDEQRGRLDIVRQSGEALLTILNDILDLSKIEAGKLELEDIPFDLEQIANGSQAPFSALAQAKGVDLSLDIDGVGGVYQGDPTRLRQILYNLTSNALKFTQTGEIALRVSAIDAGLEFRITDTGIGIPADRLQSLFESFTQVDASTARKFGGTGLGLSICRRLSEMMGGTIGVESVFGQGSSFVVTLPLPRLGDHIEEAAVAAPVLDAGEAAQLRVLAADDNEVNRLVLKTLLSQVGVEPVLVVDGVEAVAAWEREHWDLILMDVQMPTMDGIDATWAIREREAASGRARTPIIGLTANTMSHQVDEYLAAGMDDHVGKPINANRLFEAIAANLANELFDQPGPQPSHRVGSSG